MKRHVIKILITAAYHAVCLDLQLFLVLVATVKWIINISKLDILGIHELIDIRNQYFECLQMCHLLADRFEGEDLFAESL